MRTDWFRVFTSSVLVLFCLSVVLLLAADIAYLDSDSVREMFLSREIRGAFMLSLKTSLLTCLLGLVVAIPSAYALSRYRFRGSMILDITVDLLMVVPVLVVGVSLLVFFKVGRDMAVSGNPLVSYGGGMVKNVSEFFVYSTAGIVLAQFFCSVPYAIRTIKAAFDELDPRTEQVAMTLGCGRMGAFFRVTLPMARDGILAGAVLCWARAFGIFGPVVIVAGAVRGRTEVLPTSIYLEVSIGRLEMALSISMLMLATAVFVLFAIRLVSGRRLFGSGAV